MSKELEGSVPGTGGTAAGGDEKRSTIDPKTDLTPKSQLTSFSALMCHVPVVTLASVLVVVPDAVVACRT